MEIKEQSLLSFSKFPPQDLLCFLLYGEDEGRINFATKNIIKHISLDANITELTSDEVVKQPALLLDSLLTMSFSMFGDAGESKNIVIVSYCNNKLTRALKPLLDEIPKSAYGSSYIILKAGALKKSDSLPKLGFASKQIATTPFYEETLGSLSSFIKQHLNERDIVIESEALTTLAEYAKGNRELLLKEIEKIILYKGINKEGGKIDYEDILHNIKDNSDANLYEISSNVINGEIGKISLQVAKLFSQGENPVSIIRTLQNFFKRVEQVQSNIAMGKTANDAMRALRPPVFFKEQANFNKALGRYNLEKIQKCYQALYQAELKCKSNSIADKLITERALQYVAGV